MRVTFLLPRYGWHASGGYGVVYTYAGMLAERGHDVTVIHPRRLPRGGWPRPRGVGGHMRRAASHMRDLLLRPRLEWTQIHPRVRMSYTADLSPSSLPDADAVIATWWSTAEAAVSLPPRKGRPYHLIQGYEVWHGAEERVHTAWRAPLHKIFIARWLLNRALELGVSAEMTSLIPNAIDLRTFNVQHPVAGREPRVAMLYSTAPPKGGMVGLEILERAKQSVPDLTAIVFGVERAPKGLPSWITYVRGARGERLASEVYNCSAVYLCPSLSEGWHLPPAEAMACGCALVSSDIGGVSDYAIEGETAFLYPAGDAAAGAARLVELLSDDAVRTALSQRGTTRIAQFSWERSADALEALLEWR